MPQLILIRHGQSQWNLENRFTGWWDVDVTEKGAAEAWAAGELMKDKGLTPDTCFTSVQTRAIKTLNLALEAMGRLWLLQPVRPTPGGRPEGRTTSPPHRPVRPQFVVQASACPTAPSGRPEGRTTSPPHRPVRPQFLVQASACPADSRRTA